MNVAGIFTSAWQLSALAEQPKAEKERFFSNVYAVYSAIAFVTASGVILTARLSTRLLAAPEYYEAWRYVPVLTLATTFACLGSFLSSIYMVEQRSTATLVTTHAWRRLQSGGEFFPDSALGLYGAAVSTLFSYILIFTVRALHTAPCCGFIGRSIASSPVFSCCVSSASLWSGRFPTCPCGRASASRQSRS